MGIGDKHKLFKLTKYHFYKYGESCKKAENSIFFLFRRKDHFGGWFDDDTIFHTKVVLTQ